MYFLQPFKSIPKKNTSDPKKACSAKEDRIGQDGTELKQILLIMQLTK